MVNLDERLKRIKEEFVDTGSYFVINRGRQYGKTTTLDALKTYLKEDYIVLSLDFQQIATEDFADAQAFVHAFAEALLETLEISGLGGVKELTEPLGELVQKSQNRLKDLFVRLSAMCKNSPRPVVLMIDEVDSASNNQVFIDFLALLRAYYLKREERATFQSVILAGVYSIKNLKLKLRPDSEHQYNSPWNIAADFNIDMSFSPVQIEGMLAEYEQDYHTGMDLGAVAREIYAYTSGYPVLVSLVCKHLAGMAAGSGAWSKKGVERAVGVILKESTVLFESMAKQLDMYKDLYKIVEDILYCGKRIPFSMEESAVNLGVMFGFIKEENGHVAIANRMFEMCLLNMFMAREAIDSDVYTQGGIDRIGFIHNNQLNMELVLKKFVEYFTEIYSEKDAKFVERYGRKFFLLYLKPIINGTGNYYIEAQTRDERRTDLVIDYLGEQFIVELKIWHGAEYNERGEEQLSEYLDYYNKKKGYLLSFNFNKNKQCGIKEIKIGDKTIVEAVV